MIKGLRFIGVGLVVMVALNYYFAPYTISFDLFLMFLIPDLLVPALFAEPLRRIVKRGGNIAPPWWMFFCFPALPLAMHSFLHVAPTLGLSDWLSYLQFAALVVPIAFVMHLDAEIKALNQGAMGPWGRHPATRT